MNGLILGLDYLNTPCVQASRFTTCEMLHVTIMFLAFSGTQMARQDPTEPSAHVYPSVGCELLLSMTRLWCFSGW